MNQRNLIKKTDEPWRKRVTKGRCAAEGVQVVAALRTGRSEEAWMAADSTALTDDDWEAVTGLLRTTTPSGRSRWIFQSAPPASRGGLTCMNLVFWTRGDAHIYLLHRLGTPRLPHPTRRPCLRRPWPRRTWQCTYTNSERGAIRLVSKQRHTVQRFCVRDPAP